jgi:hypothetical protein
MTEEEFDQLPFKESERVRKSRGVSKKEWAVRLEEERPKIIKELAQLRGPYPAEGVPTEVLIYELVGLRRRMKEKEQTPEQLRAEIEYEIGPHGILNDLFIMLRFVKEGVVPFVWPQLKMALKMSEELSAADPVRWRQFLQECNEVQPGSIPGGMLQ